MRAKTCHAWLDGRSTLVVKTIDIPVRSRGSRPIVGRTVDSQGVDRSLSLLGGARL